MTVQTLTVDIQHYWLSGTGRGGGAMLDAVAHRDAHGLPALPGRHLKGLLRDAVENAQGLGWPGYADLAALLFGDRTEPSAEAGFIPAPGALRVSDARLPADLSAWLAQPAQKSQRPRLFRVLAATRIDPDSGTADNQTLRSVEVVVPLCLQARIEPIPGAQPPADWPQRLRAVLPLITAVGGKRNRGLGRAVLSLTPAAQ